MYRVKYYYYKTNEWCIQMDYRARRVGTGKPPRGPKKKLPQEEYAVILDFLPQGNPFDKHPEHKRSPIAQVIGDKYFTLFELVTREGEYFEAGEKIYVGIDYIGKGPIKSVSEPIEYDDLTNVAKENLPGILENIIREKESIFVNIFNIAEPITLKMHVLELLPGVGKKTLKAILEERKSRPFTSFKDLEERLSLRGVKLHNPVKVLAERILIELKGGERYYLFVRPPERAQQAVYLNYLERLYRMAKQ